MKKSLSRALGALEFTAVSAVTAFYVYHHWPVSKIEAAVALVLVVVSSLGLWPLPYNSRWYSSVYMCIGSSLMMANALRGGMSVLSLAWGYLVLRSGYNAFQEFRDHRRRDKQSYDPNGL